MAVIIGLSGYAQAGKDTLGAILVAQHGFRRVAFADKLRAMALALDPIVGAAMFGETFRLSDLIDQGGWEEAKRSPEVRRLLQRLGTEAGRDILGNDIWVNAALDQVNLDDPSERIVITDCRFLNEAQAIRRTGGYVVRIERPGIKAVNAHPSETALDGFDFDNVVLNNKSPATLAETAKKLLVQLGVPQGQ